MERLLQELVVGWEDLKAYFAFDTALLGEPGMVIRIALQVMLLICSAFFSGSETALFSLSRLDLQKLRRERNRHSETLHALLDQPRRLIMSILCGNELVNIAAAANMAGILVALYGVERAGVITVLIMVPLLLLFGEVTPKTIAVSNPVRVSTGVVAWPMSLWVKLVTPVVWAIRGVSDRVTTLIVGEEKAAENILQVDEFRSLVEAGAREGELNATERALIYNLLESGDTEVVEIMTPRTRVDFLNIESSVPEMVERFKSYQHPRVPVFRVQRDNLVGFVHAEDVLALVLDDVDLTTLTPEDIMHPPVVVPLTKQVDEMFDFFQSNQARAAAVLNEFGGVEGFVTMKDVITFIVGEVSGEVRGQEFYQEQDENVYEVPGEMTLNDFNNLTHFGIEDPRMTTIGGVAFRHLDRLPQVGDKVSVEGVEITILEMDVHRIARVHIARGGTPQEVAEEPEAEADTDTDTDTAAPVAIGDIATESNGMQESEALGSPDEEAAETLRGQSDEDVPIEPGLERQKADTSSRLRRSTGG